jgi:hypothetical protein
MRRKNVEDMMKMKSSVETIIRMKTEEAIFKTISSVGVMVRMKALQRL